MTFKDIRYLVYSPLNLIVGDINIDNVDTHDDSIDIYNNYEVIGIRSTVKYYNSLAEERLIISLKPII